MKKKFKIFISSFTLIFYYGCVPPLEDECFIAQMKVWNSAEIKEKEGKQFRFISTNSEKSLLDQQYYPDTLEGKSIYEAHSWAKCKNKR